MNSTIRFAATLVACGLTLNVHAEDFRISGGGGAQNGSVYSAMLGQLASVCSTEAMTLTEMTSSGGVVNLDRVLTNKVHAAIVPADLLYAAKLDNPGKLAMVTSLFQMHPEAVHVIVRGGVKKEGGLTVRGFNVGGTAVAFNRIEDLAGRQVGAVGGSAVTAEVLGSLLRTGWSVQREESTGKLIEALNSGKYDAIVISAGLASDAVKAVPGHFKLLPVRGGADTAAVYHAVKLEYPNLNNGKSIDSIAAPAQMVTRKWSSPAMLANLAALRECYNQKAPELVDTLGTHPAWQTIDFAAAPKWPQYELPAAKAMPPVVAPVAAPVVVSPAQPKGKK